MAKIDEKFIENLNNFSVALENIVELLKEQAKLNPTDVVNKLAENLDAENIQKISQELEEIKERTVYISDNTDKILKEVKDANKAKEAGMFEKISDKANTGKIVDGIKVVGLIAAGVLAIGTAFKIIGHVDFVTVMAISTSIVLLAHSYEKIAKMGKLTPKTAASIALIVAAIGGGLLAAGLLLKFIPTLSIMQMITIGALSIALGISMVAFSMAFDTVNIKKLLIAAATMPLMLASISLGLVTASLILQYFQPVTDPMELVLGAGAIGLSILAMVPTILLLSKIKPNQVLMGVAGIVLTSIAIAISSHILAFGDYSKAPDIMWALSVGATILAFTVPVALLGLIASTGIGLAAIGLGALATLAVAGTILAVDWLLAQGDYSKAPDIMWVLTTGLSLTLFGAGMAVAGVLFPLLALGALSALAIAGSILAVDYLLAQGDYTKSPDIMWVLTTGAAMTIFGAGMAIAGPLLPLILLGAGSVATIAYAMVEASKILTEGVWDAGYPSLDWAKGVGTSLFMFATAFALISAIEGIGGLLSRFTGKKVDFSDFIIKSTDAMVGASFALSKGNWTTDYPKEEWAKGVGGALFMFAKAFSIITQLEGFGSLMSRITGKEVDFEKFVIESTTAMVVASHLLQFGNWTSGYPTEEWAKGVGGALVMFADAFETISGIESGGWFSEDKDFGAFVTKASLSMVLASHLLTTGNWETGYPTEDWAKGVGGALVSFADAFAKITDIEDGGWFSDDKDFGSFVTRASLAMIKASELLSGGQWSDDYPKVEWAKGVSDSIITFADAFATITEIEDGGLFGSDKDFSAFVVKATSAMAIASQQLVNGNWTSSYPTDEWSKGVGNSIEIFAKAVEDIDDDFDSSLVLETIGMMVSTSMLLGAGNWTSKYPTEDWLEGVENAVDMFVDIFGGRKFNSDFIEKLTEGLDKIAITLERMSSVDMSKFNEMNSLFTSMTTVDLSWINTVLDGAYALADPVLDDDMNRFIQVMEKIGSISATNIQNITNSIVRLSRELRTINNVDNLLKMSGAFLTISVVDVDRLTDVFETMGEQASDLKDIFDEQTSQMAAALSNAGGGNTQTLISPVIEIPESENMYKLVNIVSNIDGNIEKIANKELSVDSEPGEPQQFASEGR